MSDSPDLSHPPPAPVEAKGPRAAFLAFMHRHPIVQAWSLVAPGGLWLLLFFASPLLIMAVGSFVAPQRFGQFDFSSSFTIEHYTRFLDPRDTLYLWILARTTGYSIICTVLCLLLGYPVAYTISRAGSWKNILMFFVVMPFWTSFIVRTFAIIFLMRDTGVINTFLQWTGIISEPIHMMDTPFAVIVGLVYGFMPFMILPIYSSLEKLDMSLLEAAEVLGAPPTTRFLRVTLPLSMPGVVAGSLLVFIPSLGSFVTSDLLGGGKLMMIGNLVQQQFGAAKNWPFGAAASFVMMLLVLVAVAIYLRARDAEEKR